MQRHTLLKDRIHLIESVLQGETLKEVAQRGSISHSALNNTLMKSVKLAYMSQREVHKATHFDLAKARRDSRLIPILRKLADAETVIDIADVSAESPIDELMLPSKVYNPLRRSGVLTIGQLTAMTQSDILGLEGVGQRGVT